MGYSEEYSILRWTNLIIELVREKMNVVYTGIVYIIYIHILFGRR